MDDKNLEAIARRVERLERSCRQWRSATGLVLALLCLFVLVGAKSKVQTKNEVRAKRFTLVDSAGKVRAILGEITALTKYNPYKNDFRQKESGLSLYSRKGNRVAAFVVISAYEPGHDDTLATLKLGKAEHQGAVERQQVHISTYTSNRADMYIMSSSNPYKWDKPSGQRMERRNPW